MSVERRLERGDVDFSHLHHCFLGAARGASVVRVDEFDKPLRHDLPGNAEAIGEPRTLAFAAAVCR